MKRTIITLVMVAVLGAAGILYGNYSKSDARKAVSLEEAYSAQFPEQLPEIVMHPMTAIPRY